MFKLNAVKLYLTTEKTYRELTEVLKIDCASLLPNWVRAYREKGELAFSNVHGRPRKEPDLPHTKIKSQDSTEQELSQLKQEKLRLKIELEYLKGLRRLRQEQHKRENLKWSATSLDPSSFQSKHF